MAKYKVVPIEVVVPIRQNVQTEVLKKEALDKLFAKIPVTISVEDGAIKVKTVMAEKVSD